MAKKIFGKKNYAKYLPRVGSTMAVAMAMTVALSTQVHATETDGVPTPPPTTDIPPVNNETGAPAPAVDTPIDPVQTNADIQQSNEETIQENNNTDTNNQEVQQDNNEVIQNNQEATEGELGDPNLPDLPDVPETPDIEGKDTEG